MRTHVFSSSKGGSVRARLVPAMIIVAGLVCLVIIGMLPKPEESVESLPPQAVNVVVEKVVPIASLPDTLELDGEVEPNLLVKVAAEVAGRVERYGQRAEPNATNPGDQLQEGDSIQAGAPLMYLNTDLLQASYNQAEAKHEFDLRQYERIKQAYQRNVATNSQLDEAQTSLELSEATLAEVKAKLDRTTIFAPLSGVINRLMAEVGEYVQEGTACAEIVDNSTIKVVVNVPEAEIHYFEVGQQQRIYDRLQDSLNLLGQITYISQVADSQTRTTRVEISVPNRDEALHSGQIVNVCLKRRDLTNAIMVPIEAIIPLEHGYIIYVVQDEKAKSVHDVQINVRFIRGKRILVTNGLKGGEQLIVKGQWMCGDGQPVKIISEESAEQPLESSPQGAEQEM